MAGVAGTGAAWKIWFVSGPHFSDAPKRVTNHKRRSRWSGHRRQLLWHVWRRALMRIVFPGLHTTLSSTTNPSRSWFESKSACGGFWRSG